MDWPKDLIAASAFGIFSAGAEESQAAEMAMTWGTQFATSSPWPTVNLAMYMPIVVRSQITVYKLGWSNGSAVSGNVDVGIYDKALARLVSAGATAQAGTNALQVVDTPDTTLPPGIYYLALAVDNATAALMGTGGALAAPNYRACGVAQQASAFPLPNPAALSATTQTRVPLVFGAIAGATF